MTNLHTPDAVLYHDLAEHYEASRAQIRLLRERAERAERERDELRKASSYYYLATPYTAHPDGLHEAWQQACVQAALLVRAGVPVFCPIAHSHPIAVYGHIDPRSHDIWLPMDAPLMRGAVAMIECRMPGWDKSYGMRCEREAFLAAGKAVIAMEPGVVPDVFAGVAA